MSKLSDEFTVELKEDIPDMILYCIPELMFDNCCQLYDMDRNIYLIYGNRTIIADYINEVIEEYS